MTADPGWGERLDVIRNWATDAEPDTDGPAACALRSIGHLCDVVAALTDRVQALEAEVANHHHVVSAAILRHRDTQHLP